MALSSEINSNLNLLTAQITPNEPQVSTTVILTGSVYDLSTSAYGIGLQVAVCSISGANLTIIKSAIVDNSGAYYITLNSDELSIPAGAGTQIKFCVFQKNVQLEMDSNASINIKQSQQKSTILKVHSLPSITGKVKRKNNAPAAGILVELYNENSTDPIGYDFTNVDGLYEIPYNLQVTQTDVQPKLYLKFYNNEHIYHQNEASNPVEETLSDFKSVYTGTNHEYTRSRTYTIKKFVNDLIIEKDIDTGEMYYYIIISSTKSGNNWITQQNLIYIKDEEGTQTKNYWRIVNESGTNYKILDKRVAFHASGKYRNVYIKKSNIPTPAQNGQKSITGKILLRKNTTNMPSDNEISFNSSSNIYYKEQEDYKPSISPNIFTSKRIEMVNFLFTKDSLDLYTRLKTRMSELKISESVVIESQA